MIIIKFKSGRAKIILLRKNLSIKLPKKNYIYKKKNLKSGGVHSAAPNLKIKRKEDCVIYTS